MASKISTATGDFSNTEWYIEPVGGGNTAPSGPYTVSSDGESLTLSCGTNSYDDYYTSYNNDGPWDITSSEVFLEFTPSSVIQSDSGIGLLGTTSYFYGLAFHVESGTALAVQEITSSGATDLHAAVYSAANDKWLKISESGGTITFWTAPDGKTWNEFYTTTLETVGDWTATGGVIQLYCGSLNETNLPNSEATFQSFNTTPGGGASPPSPPILGMYDSGNIPGPPSSWPSGPTTNLANDYFAMDATDQFNTYGLPFIQSCTTYGLIPYIEIEPWDYNQTGVLFSAITGGTWDTYFEQVGTAIANSGKIALVTFAHEMNVSGQYPWAYNDTGCGPGGGNLTAAEWIQGWQYAHDKVNTYANGLALWIWAPGANTGGTSTTSPSSWWPGATYVDMVGIDGYEGLEGGPITFAGVFSSTLADIKALGWTNPIYISETNLALMVQQGGDSITTFVEDMAANNMSGILEFEESGLPSMTAAQWTEYNTAIAANYPSGTTPLMQMLADTFPGSTLNTVLWTAGATAPVVANNQLALSQNTSYSSNVTSAAAYNLTGSYAFVHLEPDTTTADAADDGLEVGGSGLTNGWAIGVTGGSLYTQTAVNGTFTSVFSTAYNTAEHAWIRIRESSGTLFFETAPNAQTWTTQYTSTDETITPVTSVYAQLYAGNTGATSAGTAYFSDFNTVPAGGATPSGLLMVNIV